MLATKIHGHVGDARCRASGAQNDTAATIFDPLRNGDLSRAARTRQSVRLGQIDRADSRCVCSRINQSFQSATDHRACKGWIRGRTLAGLEAIRGAVEPGVIIVRELELGGCDVRLEL
jgi:hypothetical protein